MYENVDESAQQLRQWIAGEALGSPLINVDTLVKVFAQHGDVWREFRNRVDLASEETK